MGKNGENMKVYGNFEGAWERMDGGKSGSFWQLGKLGQVWGKYERNGEVCWMWGGVKGSVERCVGKVCLACGKCIWVGGEVWGEWKSIGRCEKCGGGV